MNAQELKNSILMRAVQGKLVPQEPNDEPASILLEKIRAEKEQLMKEKKIKKEPISVVYKDPSDNQHYEKIGKEVKCIEDEIPFEIPESWEWCRFGVTINLLSGQDFSPQYYNDNENGTPYMTGASNIENNHLVINRWTPEPKNISHKGDLLIVCKGSGYGKTVKNDIGKIHIARQFMAISGYQNIDIDYLNLFVTSKLSEIKKNGQGVIPGIDRISILSMLLPLPPVNEQIRILKKYEEFEPLIHQYGTHSCCLNEINETMPSKLKASILQYAIQGKLVPQDPNDEPASVLLERIRAEKEQMIKDGKIKRDKNESYIYRGSDNSYYLSFQGNNTCIDDEIPFEIPDSWCWVTLSSICTYIQRGKSPKYSDIAKIPVVAQKCNQWSGFDISKAKFIEPETLVKYEKERLLSTGDLLWNSTGLGTVGRMAVYDEEKNPYRIAVADSHVSVIRTIETFANYEYLFYWFTSPAVQGVIESKTEGSTKQKELYLQKIKDYIVPLPPLKEQTRIVDNVKKYIDLEF